VALDGESLALDSNTGESQGVLRMTSAPSAPAPAARRHALGLPAGSIRALHTLTVVVLVCLPLVLPGREGQKIPIRPYLVYLLFLALGHFYAAHGKSISLRGADQPSPWHLPAGFFRTLCFLLLLATFSYCRWFQPAELEQQLRRSLELLPQQPFLPLVILAGFFLGILAHLLLGEQRSPWAQDLQAWLSLIAGLLLAIDALIRLVIEPSLPAGLDLPTWEGLLAGVVAFYFGERS
jgi:hypothetical protein